MVLLCIIFAKELKLKEQPPGGIFVTLHFLLRRDICQFHSNFTARPNNIARADTDLVKGCNPPFEKRKKQN